MHGAVEGRDHSPNSVLRSGRAERRWVVVFFVVIRGFNQEPRARLIEDRFFALAGDALRSRRYRTVTCEGRTNVSKEIARIGRITAYQGDEYLLEGYTLRQFDAVRCR